MAEDAGTGSVVEAGERGLRANSRSRTIWRGPAALALEHVDDMTPRRTVAETLAVVESTEVKPPALTIKDLDPSERPRERLIERGPEALSNAELLAILLRTGVAGLMATDLARKLLHDYSGLRGLAGASARELATEHGLGPAKAAQLKAALQLGRRLVEEELAERPKVGGPEDLYNLVRLEMEVLDQEELWIFLLDTKNRVMTTRPLYRGSL
ncbi:MAG TPA: UPF0758 domain-containing protein, partial [Chloroflexota bacterium]|nr:UPF0758 domain-containing protein [Chloroflexota bacterium]